VGFKNTKKSSPYAAQKCTESIAKVISEYGIKELELKTKGIGAGRDIFIKQMLADKNFVISCLVDKTPIAHGGCRPRKCPRK
jgi:small subunit ribosomal protein S11